MTHDILNEATQGGVVAETGRVVGLIRPTGTVEGLRNESPTSTEQHTGPDHRAKSLRGEREVYESAHHRGLGAASAFLESAPEEVGKYWVGPRTTLCAPFPETERRPFAGSGK